MPSTQQTAGVSAGNEPSKSFLCRSTGPQQRTQGKGQCTPTGSSLGWDFQDLHKLFGTCKSLQTRFLIQSSKKMCVRVYVLVTRCAPCRPSERSGVSSLQPWGTESGGHTLDTLLGCSTRMPVLSHQHRVVAKA